MKLALVFDAPRSTGSPLDAGVGGAYLSRTLNACRVAAGVKTVEIQEFYAVSEPLPGGKAPPIAMVRKERDRLVEEILAWEPDKILSIGAGALNALAVDATKVQAISKHRGRMRWWGPESREVPWVPTISHMAVVKSSDLHRDLAYDAYKVLSQAEPMPEMDIEMYVPDTTADLQKCLLLLEGASAVGVDVETTGLRPATDDLLAVGIGATFDDRAGLAVIVTKELLPYVEDTLWDAVWRRSRRAVGHNFKFDMQYLAPLIGWAPDEALIGDTLLLAHLLDERPNKPTSRVRGLGLKELVATRYDHDYGFDFGEFYATPDDEKDWDAMHAYLAEDVVYTARLWHDLSAEARDESPRLLEAHDDLLMPVSKAIARCEFGGAPVSVPWIRETIVAYDRRIARRERALKAALPRLTTRQEIALGSAQQIADVMYDDWKMTPDVRKHGKLVLGDRSTDKDHIRAAVAKYLGSPRDREARWLRTLERYRRDVSQRTKYQKQLLDKVDSDGRVRASFLIHGTSTGRLSSQQPNLQNIPAIDREDALTFRPMRRAFAPQPPYLWVEVDYSQLELRVAAALSRDPALIAVFTSGRDVHQEIASAIFSKPYDEIAKAERFLAKAVSFGIIYGRGGRALAGGKEMDYAERELGMKRWSEDQANAFIRKFLRDYPTLNAWMEHLYATVPAQSFVESPFGRRRRFPLTPKSKGELGSIQRQAVNTPVQSAASDICLQAMVELQRTLEPSGLDARVLFTVHDSICLEVREDQVEVVEAICRKIMEREWEGVPLTVDYEVGPTWADVRKVK